MHILTLDGLRRTVSDVLRILRLNNLSLNKAKCEYDKTRIIFSGHDLDENGFHVDDMKIRDIRKFRRPQTVSELRSFLGLASFVSAHIRNFAQISSPLWHVTTANSWVWGDEQDKAFSVIGDKIIHCTTSLGYFSEHDETFLYTDTSPVALGAVLVQKGQKRRFASDKFRIKSSH